MSLRHFLKRYLPNRDHFHGRGDMNMFSAYLHDPNIWHIHRRSAAGGAAIGMFCAFIPMPVHTLCSITLSILCRVNLPIAVAFSFFSNPLTIPPLFYFCYRVGTQILGIKQQDIHLSFSWEWVNTVFVQIWEPLLLGCGLVGTSSALLVYLIIRLIWRFTAINKWLNRR